MCLEGRWDKFNQYIRRAHSLSHISWLWTAGIHTIKFVCTPKKVWSSTVCLLGAACDPCSQAFNINWEIAGEQRTQTIARKHLEQFKAVYVYIRYRVTVCQSALDLLYWSPHNPLANCCFYRKWESSFL